MRRGGNVFCDEMAKEGSASDIAYYTRVPQVLRQDKGFAQINYDDRGVRISDNESSPFHNASCTINIGRTL